MDITSEFRKVVRQETSKQQASLAKNEKSTKRFDILPPKRLNFAHPENNVYLAEAYIIAKHLEALQRRIVDIRPAYLNLKTRGYRTYRLNEMGINANKRDQHHRHTVTKLSDPERNEIDQNIKAAIRQILDRIQGLGEVGQKILHGISDDGIEGTKELFKRLVGALDPRNAGKAMHTSGMHQVLGKRELAAAHQSSIAWWLNFKLQKTNKIHAEMQELYFQQKLERQRGALSGKQSTKKPTNASHDTYGNSIKTNDGDDPFLSHLSTEELQMLQQENDSMVQEFESAMDKIKETQRSLLEISTLQSQLATELNVQAQQAERLYNEAVGAVDSVDQGNMFLVSAKKNQATARKWILVIFIVLSLVLLFLDWFD